jgi:asparagine synthase (glutamine-hydrolysing)
LRARARDGQVELDGPRRFVPPPAWPPAWLDETAPPAPLVLGPLLRETVALHLVADVPVALLLSGGVDSTAVAALLRAARPDAEVTAFTIAREDDPDELAAATETARRLRLQHRIVSPTEDALREQVPRFLAALDQPSVDGLNTFVVSGAVAAAGFKAALSGLGSDELFGGYALHRRMAWLWPLLDAIPRLPGALSRGLMRVPAVGRPAKALSLLAARGVADDRLGAALDLRLHALFSPQEVAALLELDPSEVERDSLDPTAEDAGLGALPPGLSPRSRREVAYHGAMLLLRAGYLRRTLLRDADALSMAHGLELRVPLCDEALWQAVLARRPRPDAPPKQLLIEAAAHPRVREVAARPKRGFVLPLVRWLAGPLRELAGDLLSSSGARAAGLSAPAVERLQNAFLARPSSAVAHRLWALCALSDYLLRHGLGAA